MIEAVIVAAIAATPPGALAALAWRNGKHTRAEVGQTNGDGTLADMMSKVLKGQGRIEERLDQHIRDDADSIESIQRRLDWLVEN